MKYLLVILTFSFSCLSLAGYDLPAANTPVPLGVDTRILKELQEASARITAESKKALVFISVSKTMKNMPRRYSGDPFEFFFDRRFREFEAPKQEGLGSGFMLDLEKGYVLTNNHVIDGADVIDLKLANGKTYQGEILGRDDSTDIAVVRIKDEKYDRSGLNILILGDSDRLRVGHIVFSLGAPFGLEASVSQGVISAVERGALSITKMGDFIQTDAVINPGNSGGPLVDVDGRVIGINTAIASRSGGSQGVGFAVPSNLVRKVATSLINGGHFSRGFIGVSFQPLQDEWVPSLGLPKDTKGVIVAQVTPDGPAEKAGITPGDVLVAINGKPINDANDLTNAIGLMGPGSNAKITYFREGNQRTATAKISEWPGSEKQVEVAEKAPSTGDYGLAFEDVSRELKQKFGFSSSAGVVVTYVEPGSPAYRVGLAKGDVILIANGRKIKNVRDLDKILKASKELIVLHVEARDGLRVVALQK